MQSSSNPPTYQLNTEDGFVATGTLQEIFTKLYEDQWVSQTPWQFKKDIKDRIKEIYQLDVRTATIEKFLSDLMHDGFISLKLIN